MAQDIDLTTFHYDMCFNKVECTAQKKVVQNENLWSSIGFLIGKFFFALKSKVEIKSIIGFCFKNSGF